MPGVFSTEVTNVVGFGATKKRTTQRILVFAEDAPRGEISIRLLNNNMVPIGDKQIVTAEELVNNYIPEPDVYLCKVKPEMTRLETHTHRGDEHRKSKELYSAEFEYNEALNIDEDYVRATFGIGLVYLEREDVVSAEKVFDRIIDIKAAFAEEHKHLFNEFGIMLRKRCMHQQAVVYYERAKQLCDDDEHLLYNLGRALFESGDLAKAKIHVEDALDLNPEFKPGEKLLRYLENTRSYQPAPSLYCPMTGKERGHVVNG